MVVWTYSTKCTKLCICLLVCLPATHLAAKASLQGRKIGDFPKRPQRSHPSWHLLDVPEEDSGRKGGREGKTGRQGHSFQGPPLDLRTPGIWARLYMWVLVGNGHLWLLLFSPQELFSCFFSSIWFSPISGPFLPSTWLGLSLTGKRLRKVRRVKSSFHKISVPHLLSLLSIGISGLIPEHPPPKKKLSEVPP